MKFSVSAATLIALIPAVLGLTVNTPTGVVQCQPILLAWSGGTPPYYVTLIPGGQVSATPLKSFDAQTGTQLTWTVDLQANTNFNIALKDSTGAIAYSDIVTVQASSDNSCLNNTSSDVTVPSGTNTGGSSPVNTATGNPSNSSPGSGGSGTSTRTSTTSTPSTSSSGGATGLALSSFGVAGVIGAIAALF